MTIERIAIALLAAGVVASAGGWHLQDRAAMALTEARRIQGAEIPEQDSAPPSAESNRAIVENLQRGTQMRQEIDAVLTKVRASVARLGTSQDAAFDIAGDSRALLEEVAGSLGASLEATRSSVSNLGKLDGRLTESRRLGLLILAELAELDRRLGPSAGEP